MDNYPKNFANFIPSANLYVFQKVSHDLNNEKMQRILRIIIGFPS